MLRLLKAGLPAAATSYTLRRRLLAAVAMLPIAGLISPHALAQSAPLWPARVNGQYEISFNGISVGTFNFSSQTDGQNYTMAGSGKLSLLFGAIKWSGDTNTRGLVGPEGPRPQGFQFAFRSNSKSGTTRIGFGAQNTVTSVLHDPPAKPRDNAVPVTDAHLKGVVDPLSALMVISKGTAGDPCSRRIPIYDGKERFDLVLSPRGQARIAEQQPSGQPGVGYVCRVKYVPIAGHKADQESKFMSQTDGIEMVLRPIPSANVFVPYEITIPTIAGTAKISARRVDISTGSTGREQIALVN